MQLTSLGPPRLAVRAFPLSCFRKSGTWAGPMTRKQSPRPSALYCLPSRPRSLLSLSRSEMPFDTVFLPTLSLCLEVRRLWPDLEVHFLQGNLERFQNVPLSRFILTLLAKQALGAPALHR